MFANTDVSPAEREVLRSLQARKPHQVTQSYLNSKLQALNHAYRTRNYTIAHL